MKSSFCIDFNDVTNNVCVAHEVGHALGLQHPKNADGTLIDSCNPESATTGFGGPRSIGETGFDYFQTYLPCVGTPSSSASVFCPSGEAAVIPYDGSVAFDGASGFMDPGAGWYANGVTNPDGDWISPYLWNLLLKKPLSPDWSLCSPPKIPTSAALPMATASTADTPMPAIVVTGQIASGGLTGSIGSLFQVQSKGPFAVSDPLGAYCLDAMSGLTQLSTYCFNLSFQAPETGAPLAADFFARKLLLPTGTDRILLRAGNNILDQKARSATAPSVSITSPAFGGTVTGTLNLAWTGSDADGNALTYTVLYSRDNGASFVPLAVNIAATSLSVDSALLAGGQQAFVRVLASDGFNTASADSATLQVANKPPHVFITAPANNAVTSSADKVFLSGAAQDPQDGELTAAANLSWKLDGTGSLGTGPDVIVPSGMLSSGSHVISLTAQNSGGQSATTSVTVQVTQPPVAVCKNVTVSADAKCTATASIDNGSYDPEGGAATIMQNPAGPYGLGTTSVGLTITDQLGVNDRCIGVVTVQDTTAPVISCNAPATILTSNVPISFTASAIDACSGATATTINGFSCYVNNGSGRPVSKANSCVVQVTGSTITILNSGGIGDNIDWTVTSSDASGNIAASTCHLLVVKK